MNKLSIGYLKREKVSDISSLSQEQTLGWQIESYKFPEIWAQTKGETVKIAILDTAVDLNHPDIEIKGGWDFTKNQELSNETPVEGHGTHVAGIIGAKDNNQGIVGVAPEAELYSCAVLGDDGSGSYDWIISAIDWCIENKMDVINMSLGGGKDTSELYEANRRAYDAGLPLICAAGNSSWETGHLDYLASYNESIAVASINKYMMRSSFSSIGPNIDLAAPGSDILSCTPNNTYSVYSGTSMATPFVTGLVALMISKHRTKGGNSPVKCVEDVREHLIGTAHDANYDGQDNYTGHGLVNPFGVINKEAKEEQEKIITYKELIEGIKVHFEDKTDLFGDEWQELFLNLGIKKNTLNSIMAGEIKELKFTDDEISKAL